MVLWLKAVMFGSTKALSSEVRLSRLGSSVGVSQPTAEACAHDMLQRGAHSPSDKNRRGMEVLGSWQLF